MAACGSTSSASVPPAEAKAKEKEKEKRAANFRKTKKKKGKRAKTEEEEEEEVKGGRDVSHAYDPAVIHDRPNESFYDLDFREEYYKQFKLTNAFDVNVLPKNRNYLPCCYILPVRDPHVKSTRILLEYLAYMALMHYHNHHTTGDYIFKEIVKANARGCSGVEYYITFLAEDATKQGQGVQTFQAAVLYGFGKAKVWSCDLK